MWFGRKITLLSKSQRHLFLKESPLRLCGMLSRAQHVSGRTLLAFCFLTGCCKQKQPSSLRVEVICAEAVCREWERERRGKGDVLIFFRSTVYSFELGSLEAAVINPNKVQGSWQLWNNHLIFLKTFNKTEVFEVCPWILTSCSLSNPEGDARGDSFLGGCPQNPINQQLAHHVFSGHNSSYYLEISWLHPH